MKPTTYDIHITITTPNGQCIKGYTTAAPIKSGNADEGAATLESMLNRLSQKLLSCLVLFPRSAGERPAEHHTLLVFDSTLETSTIGVDLFEYE